MTGVTGSSWDFRGFKKSGIHSLGKYPATMVAEMQFKLLKEWTTGTNQVVLDPFMGSGTSLVEAQRLGFDAIGIDINPYAVLLSQVKTHNYGDVNWHALKARLSERLFFNHGSIENWHFSNIDKWFRPDIIRSLTKVRNAILHEDDIWIRRYLWICMSEVIYYHSNDRTSTFKMHVKPNSQIKNIKDDVIETFLEIVFSKKSYLPVTQQQSVRIVSGDAKKACESLATNSIDVICTSPPYGENATTVTYGQFSILFLKWIDERDISGDEKLLDNFSAIDSFSLGGKNAELEPIDIRVVEEFVNSIAIRKQQKVRRFLSDYLIIIKQLSRVLKRGGVALFTVGNRRVDGVQQPLDLITVQMFKKYSVQLIDEEKRHILSKKMPVRLSSDSKGTPVKSMNEESILIFKKV
ncbi:DNA methyltransferase [Lacticaseibacillus thailandensis]|uniref:Modification methylase n=2 Tax=Lacticaseibacillus thailandensis TaxID=381741 RepID=A0A0R2C7L7_9LACO|nr:DNA methyltransferase [Lacticaseibacillus thailandensis]KRM87640.1 modification methylase [Lacticaseibacillus thailandensis DSM 22698 = JCM 13996]